MLLFIIIIISFSLYIQLDPGMGNIWIRKNSDGDIWFSFISLLNLIIYPLKEINMWNLKMWNINFYIWVISIYSIDFFL